MVLFAPSVVVFEHLGHTRRCATRRGVLRPAVELRFILLHLAMSLESLD